MMIDVMEKKIILWVLFGSLLVLAIAVLVPSEQKVVDESKLPWNIVIDGQNNSTAFGITLGQTSLLDAEKALNAGGKMSLFLSNEGIYSVEVFIDSIYLSGLKADLFLTLDVSQQQAKEMFERGVNVSRATNKTNKVTLSEDDQKALALVPVRHILYIPRANLDADLLLKRFGLAQQKIKESDKVTHWLYPNKGLDIALNEDGREILQYVLPKNFSQIVDPLKAMNQNPVPSLRP